MSVDKFWMFRSREVIHLLIHCRIHVTRECLDILSIFRTLLLIRILDVKSKLLFSLYPNGMQAFSPDKVNHARQKAEQLTKSLSMSYGAALAGQWTSSRTPGTDRSWRVPVDCRWQTCSLRRVQLVDGGLTTICMWWWCNLFGIEHDVTDQMTSSFLDDVSSRVWSRVMAGAGFLLTISVEQFQMNRCILSWNVKIIFIRCLVIG